MLSQEPPVEFLETIENILQITNKNQLNPVDE